MSRSGGPGLFQRLIVGGWDVKPTFSSYKLVQLLSSSSFLFHLPPTSFSLPRPLKGVAVKSTRQQLAELLCFSFFLYVSFSAQQTCSLCVVSSSTLYHTLSFGLQQQDKEQTINTTSRMTPQSLGRFGSSLALYFLASAENKICWEYGRVFTISPLLIRSDYSC